MTDGPQWRLLALSAEDPADLRTAARVLGETLLDQPGMPLGEVADTLAGRPARPHRLALVAGSTADAAQVLLSGDGHRAVSGVAGDPTVVFAYPGVGDHHPAMVSGLYRHVPGFRTRLDRLLSAARDETGHDARDHLRLDADPRERVPVGAAETRTDLAAMLGQPPRPGPLDEPEVCQVLVFAVEVALAAVLCGVGLRPGAVVGYSVGEYAAACTAGVIDELTGARLVARRAALMATTPPGAMLAVLLGADRLAGYLTAVGDERLVTAALDGPRLSVVSGPVDSVERLAEVLARDIVAARRLPVRHGFHSPLLAPVAAPVGDAVAAVRLDPPRIRMLSNVTGTWLTTDQAVSPRYWTEHMCRPVRFTDNLTELWRLPAPLLVEVGPGRTLGTLATSHPSRRREGAAVDTMPGPVSGAAGLAMLLHAVGQAWVRGAPVDVAAVQALTRPA